MYNLFSDIDRLIDHLHTFFHGDMIRDKEELIPFWIPIELFWDISSFLINQVESKTRALLSSSVSSLQHGFSFLQCKRATTRLSNTQKMRKLQNACPLSPILWKIKRTLSKSLIRGELAPLVATKNRIVPHILKAYRTNQVSRNRSSCLRSSARLFQE